MNDITLFGSASPFDAIKGDGDTWSARALMPLVGYGADWRNFADAVERAKQAAANAGHDVDSLFVGVTEKSGGRPRADYRLARFACYLVAMNGDPRKPEVAAAQTYFAIRTREAETAVPAKPMSELDMARNYVAALERNAELEPKAEAYDAFMTADGDYPMGVVAQMLGTGQNRLFARLRDEHILIAGGDRHNTPYQQYTRHFRVATRTFTDETGEQHADRKTYVKPSGVDWIRKVLKMPTPVGS